MINGEYIKGKLYHFRDSYKQKHLQKKYNVTIGEYSYGTPIVHFGKLENKRLVIGKFCSVGKNVHVYLGGNHRMDWVTMYPFPAKFAWAKQKGEYRVSKGDVIVGNDVWIGAGATILSGISIGNGAVIGAGAMVTKDIPPYSVAVGNPARIVKYRFSQEDIDFLQKIEWWNWSIEKIQSNIDYLLAGDMEAFRHGVDSVYE